MILGASHFPVSCKDIELGGKILELGGLKRNFSEPSIPNHEAKKPFLTRYQPLHRLDLWKPDQGPGIELIDHGHLDVSSPPAFLPFLGCAPQDGIIRTGPQSGHAAPWRDALGIDEPAVGFSPSLGFEYWYDPVARDGQPAVKALMLPVQDLEQAGRFWCDGLNFRETGRGRTREGQTWRRLSFMSPIPVWRLILVLVEGKEEQRLAKIDTAGFNCVSFLSSDIARDRDNLCKYTPADNSEIFKLTVNKKDISVGILRGISGELIELIEMPNNIGKK